MTGQPLQFAEHLKTNAVSAAKQLKSFDPKLVANARKLVSQTFYGEMLKQMRNSPFKSDLFDGGRGGQVFNEMLDQHLAEHMSKASGSKLVLSIVKSIAKKKAAAAYHEQSKNAGNAASTDVLNPKTLKRARGSRRIDLPVLPSVITPIGGSK